MLIGNWDFNISRYNHQLFRPLFECMFSICLVRLLFLAKFLLQILQNEFFLNHMKLSVSLFDLVSSALLLVSSSSDSVSSALFLVSSDSDSESTDSVVVVSYSLCRYAMCSLNFSSDLKLHRHSKHLYSPKCFDLVWLSSPLLN